MYDLANHPEIKSAVRQEVLKNLDQNGKITKKGLNNMKLLKVKIINSYRIIIKNYILGLFERISSFESRFTI